MAMPAPDDDDPRWSFDMAGGALMDLGCYGLHVMRTLGRLSVPGLGGRPSVTRAHAEQRTPEVDAWCDVELGFPGGATALSANSMVADDYSYTIRIVGTAGDLLVHDFIKPNEDDRTDHQHRCGHHRRATRHPVFLLVPAGGLRRARAGRDTAPVRHRRRGREHGHHRRRVPRGGHAAAVSGRTR